MTRMTGLRIDIGCGGSKKEGTTRLFAESTRVAADGGIGAP